MSHQHRAPVLFRLILLLFVCSLAGCTTFENRRPGPPQPYALTNALSVMSFNIRLGLGQAEPTGDIRHMSWGRELDAVIRTIKSTDPDIAGLQEVAGIDQMRAIAAAVDMNFAFSWHGDGAGRWWGVGVLSKFPISASRRAQISWGSGNTRHIAIATLATGITQIDVASIHKDKDLKDGSSILYILEALADTRTPTLLIGDFNMVPDDKRLNPLAGRFVDTAAVVDTASARKARTRGTFVTSKRRIDYVFADKAHFVVSDAGLVPEGDWHASDHIAYITKLTMIP